MRYLHRGHTSEPRVNILQKQRNFSRMINSEAINSSWKIKRYFHCNIQNIITLLDPPCTCVSNNTQPLASVKLLLLVGCCQAEGAWVQRWSWCTLLFIRSGYARGLRLLRLLATGEKIGRDILFWNQELKLFRDNYCIQPKNLFVFKLSLYRQYLWFSLLSIGPMDA